MGKVLLWLVWAAELLLFVAGAGCVVMLFSVGDLRLTAVGTVAVAMLIASVALCGFGVFKAAQLISSSGSSNRIALYMLLPVAAVFLFSGSCVVVLQG